MYRFNEHSAVRVVRKLFMLWCLAAPVPGAAGGSDTLTVRSPLKVNGEWPHPLLIGETVARFEDTVGVTHRFSRLLNAEGIPEGYSSHIETPVCSDTLCALLDIRMYWTLAGGYWGYDTITGKPLTKNDHLEFDEKDYQKLHELLMDEQSILRRRHKDDLFDKEEKRVSQVVDAVTGATAKEVKEAVVDGAVYTSYTLYHLVHSQLAAVVRQDVKEHLLDELSDRLIRSPKIDERIFLVRELDAGQIRHYIGEIVATLPLAVPIDRLYLMKKIPPELWAAKDVQVPMAGMARDWDVHSLSHFLNQLKVTETIHLESLQKLAELVPRFSVNQLKTYLGLLEKNDAFAKDPEIRLAVRNAIEDPRYRYRDLLSSFLNRSGATP